MYRKVIKRLIDVVFAAATLFLLMPLLLLVACAVKIDTAGPILFRQRRLGMDGKIFEIYKLRTMTHVARRHDTQIYDADPAVTRMGRILRRYKIDELPQLFNVLKGDMSIIGPRPCLPELQRDFDENGRQRTRVRPGLTGLAQVNGNVYLSWPERWRLDRAYVDGLSFATDCRILLRTFLVLVHGEQRLLS